MKLRNHFTVAAIYFVVIAAIFSLAVAGLRAQSNQSTQATASPQPSGTPKGKPFFSLSTNRTYGTSDRARIWISYQNIDALDFRVYQVNDPVKFFKQLNDPHQMGEQEKTEVAASYSQKKGPTVLERIGDFKRGIFYSVRNYFRGQLKRESRAAFNEKFRGQGGEGDRLPLNFSDYATVPLLNSQQIKARWKQPLTPLENEWDNRMISLGRLDAGVYLIEAVNGDLRAYTVAVVTDLTMVNKTAPGGEMVVFAVDRKSGEPRANMKVEIVRGRKTLASGTTDSSGILKTRVEKEKLNPPPQDNTPPEDRDPEKERSEVGRDDLLIMASGNQFAISDLSQGLFGWYGDEGGEGDEGEYTGNSGEVTGYIYTDRPVYRPAQKVYFKGILRRLGEAGYEGAGARTVNVTVEDNNNGKLLEKEIPLSARGTFSGEVEITGAAPLGYYSIVAKVSGSTARGSFEVQEYKKPEYKVTVKASKQFINVGDTAKYAVEAKYFFGSPVSNAEVKYYIYRSRYYHWWWQSEDDGIGKAEGEDEDEEGGYYGYGNDMVQEGEGKLDANGRLTVDFKVPQPDEKDRYDYTYRLEAQVTDASRRVIEGKAGFVGTRGSVVAYAQPERYVYYKDETAKIKVRSSDYEGKPVPAKITLRFVERRYEKVANPEAYRGYEYKLRETELSTADVATNAQGEASYDYRIPITGSIDIQTIVNENGKKILSEGGYLWATDRDNKWADYAYRDDSSIKLIPDKKSYKPGETAHVLAMLPTDKAHLLVTTELASIMTARKIDVAGRTVMIDVPIEARYAPNAYLCVSYVRDGELYNSDKMLAVPAKDKFLSLEIIPNKKEYKPREAASYTVLARNANGSPAAGAEVSLGVVDEAVYSIRPENSGDIRRAFYGTRPNSVQTNFSTSYNFSGYSGDKPVQIAKNKRSYQLADFKNESQYAEPTIRKEFKDTAFWQPDVITGADGKATVNFTLPDNLTTWRATARAVTADTKVGSGVGKVLARKDLILRLETPRFLTEGDTVTLSGIVHNYLDSDKQTEISIEVNGAQLLDQPKQTVTVKKQGEVRIDWRIAAPQVGKATLLAKALTNAESDAIELPLEIVPQGLRQTKGNTLTLSDESVEKTLDLNLPANANNIARSLRIEASPSITGTLFGALDYLTSYPYGCTEQTMSSFLPNIIVAQVLKDVKGTTIRATNNLDQKVQRGLDKLYGYQHTDTDGGWGWWKNDKTDPFMTAYVVDGLTQARAAGYAIVDWRLSRARDALKKMIEANKDENGKAIDAEERAYMIYALYAADEGDAKYLGELFNSRGSLQPYGRALLALALKKRGDGRSVQVAGEIERSARANEFEAYWESQRKAWYGGVIDEHLEATALSLKALAQISPKSPLLPKTARWLISNRQHGCYWYSTKDTSFALLGLVDYVKVSQELAPDYTVEVYLNGEQVLTKRLTAADVASKQPIVIERKGTALANGNQVRIVKRGKGTLWFSSALDYYTRIQGNEQVAAAGSNDLKLTREYLRLRVDESGDKPKWVVEPLAGEVRSGDLIVVRLHLTGNRAQRLLVEDPIPAGCEQIDRAYGIAFDYTTNRWTSWYSMREFRDQKTALFTEYFDGDATYQYALRVQIPGDFKVAPARAERMYQPTVQSNTANAGLKILDKK